MSSVRELFSGISTAIAQKLIKPALFIQADFPSGTRRVWTGLGDIVFAGATWNGIGDIKGLDSFVENMDSAANGVMCSFDAIDDAGILSAVLGDDYQGSDATIYLSFYNTSTGYLIGGNAVGAPLSDEADTTAWKAAVAGAGGTVLDEEAEICNQIISQIDAAGYRSKIKYFLPFLGSNINSAIQPLIDDIAVGAPTNDGFVDADFDRATSIVHASPDTNTLITSFNVSTNPELLGLGAYTLTKDATGAYLLGYINDANTKSWDLVVASNPIKRFTYGSSSSNGASVTTAISQAAGYYGQSPNYSERKLYVDGSYVAQNLNAAAPTGYNDNTFYIYGSILNSSKLAFYGSLACAYFTTGDLTPTEIAHLNTLIDEQLVTARAALSGLSIPDYTPLILWEGHLDRDEITSAPGESKIALYAEHKLVDQLRKRVSRWTYADQKRLYPATTDNGLNWIEKIQDKSIPWGRSDA
jgi:hypothetical protein